MPSSQTPDTKEIAFKTLTPLPSQTEQGVVLDEYGIHLAQFSIAIKRVLGGVSEAEKARAISRLLTIGFSRNFQMKI